MLVLSYTQVMLDSLSLCGCGIVLPSLEPAKDRREEEAGDDDATVLRKDVIKVGPLHIAEQMLHLKSNVLCVRCVRYMQGLLQVKLLPRLRYILEVMTPPPPVIDMILRILTQTSRHSLQSASEVTLAP